MNSLKHINKYFYKYRWYLLLGILFVAVSNIFGVYSFLYVGDAMDFVDEISNLKDTEAAYKQLLYYGGLVIGLAIVSGFFLFLMRQTIIVMSRLIEYDLKNEIYVHYQQLDMSFYKRHNTGDLMNRISEDVSRVRMYIGPAIMYILNTLFSFVFTIYFMIQADAELTFYVLLPLPILVISIYYVSQTINKKSTAVQEQLSAITTEAQEAFSGIRVLKAYAREQHSEQNFEKESIEYRRRNMGLVKTEALFQPFMVLLIGLSTILAIYIGGLHVINGKLNVTGTKITVGTITQFVLLIGKLSWPIASLGWVTSLIQRAAASQTRINEFLHTTSSIQNNSDNIADTPLTGEIVFDKVDFTYTDSGIQALKNVSFKVPKGGSLAIIGKTGSGKSTIANLICRLYDADKGSILIDGKNIKSRHLYGLRQQLGYVPQEVFLFSDTIAHNIGFSVDTNKQQQAAIEQAAKDAAVYDNIMGFPEKFDTIIGERGITLSGGQKQRISIARALIKQPKILILDDCLSAVDTETEEQILEGIKNKMKLNTTIIISHRVSSVKNADQIIVMENGSIIEEGTHQKLMEMQKSYFQLFNMQLLEKEKDLTN
ncbi:MAG TPA: ABC transporter ATP-binding protein [Bacteroidia bacterium]|nr:ABC transporter ATP-binding protein [Bacteroidia bacterium]